jgi:hypothetical protein
LHKYQAPVQNYEKSVKGDQRGVGRRLFDSTFANFLRALSVLLGVYAPTGMLFGVALIMYPLGRNSTEEIEFERQRQAFGYSAFAVVASGFIAAYASYRTWGLASKVKRANRRRAKGLTD